MAIVVFGRAGVILTIMATHSDDTPHKCNVCFKSFKQKYYLTVHLGVHTGERPHVCSLCSKSFSLKGNLSTHIKTHSADYKAKDGGLPAYSTTSDRTEYPGLHSSEVPFIVNVKQEEGI